MLKQIIFSIFLVNLVSLSTFSQTPVKEYEPPKVIEGSNLLLNSNPNMHIFNSDNSLQQTRVSYNIDINANYTRWRLTNSIDYTFKANISTYFRRYSYPIFENRKYYSSLFLNMRGGLSYYLLKNKFFIGTYAKFSQSISNSDKPRTYISLFPNIGYGKIIDAMVVNETSNFEKVLLKENYISKPFDNMTRQIINNLLDKRNHSEYYSKYKDDAEIEFFTELEKYLLREKVISKPLNARATIKLLQTLENSSFILFPLFKGYQLQAEFNYIKSNTKDTIVFPQTITLNGAYGLPLGSKTSLLFTSHFIFPISSSFNVDYRQFNMHSPIFLKSEFQLENNYSLVNPSFIYLGNDLYDYKAAASVYLFHYLNPTVGIIGSIEYTTGKKKLLSKKLDNFLNADAVLLFNILNKMKLSTGVHFSQYPKDSYNFSFSSGISYFIF